VVIFKHSRRLFRPLLRDLWPTFVAAMLTVTGVGLLLIGTRTLLQAAIVPDPHGLLAMLGGLLPATLALALPIAALVASVTTGRQWAEGGELRALGVVGLSRATLVLPLFLVGLGLGGAHAVLTHHLEPWGLAQVRQVLAASLVRVQPRPGEPIPLGELWLSVEGVQGGRLEGVVLAQGDQLIAASEGHVDLHGTLHLDRGVGLRMSAQGIGARVEFSQARLTVARLSPRLELVERSGPSLRDLIVRMQADGHRAASERMALLKRSLVPLSVPLLVLLGLPLGARRARPGAVALVVVLGWWLLMRLCDRWVHELGPELAAGAPSLLLASCALWAWARFAQGEGQ
jgi:lipopolysaccharide export LptBFGC system permease protein LptF